MKNNKSNIILLIITFGYTIIYMDKMLISLSIIPIAEELALTPSQVGDIMGLYFLGYAAMQIPSGLLADKLGSKMVLLLSLIIATLSIAFFSTISVFGLMLATRLVTGIGHAGYPSSASKTISDNFEPSKRVFAQSIILSSSGLGGILAATLGAFLIAQGWRIAYVGLAALYAVSLIAVLLVLPKAKKSEGQVVKEKVDFKKVFANPNVYIIAFVSFCLNVVLYGVISWLPMYLKNQLHVEATTISTIVAANAILTVLITVIVGKLITTKFKDKERIFILITSLISAALLPLFVTITSVSLAVPVAFGMSVFAMASFTTIFALPHKVIDPSIIGVSFGIISTGGILGGFIANKVIGSLVEASGGYTSSFFFLAACAAASGVCALLIKTKTVNE